MNDIKNKPIPITLNVHQLIGLRYAAGSKLLKHRKEALRARNQGYRTTHDNAVDAWEKTVITITSCLKDNLTPEEFSSLKLPEIM